MRKIQANCGRLLITQRKRATEQLQLALDANEIILKKLKLGLHWLKRKRRSLVSTSKWELEADEDFGLRLLRMLNQFYLEERNINFATILFFPLRSLYMAERIRRS